MQAAALWWKGRLQPNGEVHAPHAPRCYSQQPCGGEAGNPRHPCLGGFGIAALVRGVLTSLYLLVYWSTSVVEKSASPGVSQANLAKAGHLTSQCLSASP